jgi:hypothetical protein
LPQPPTQLRINSQSPEWLGWWMAENLSHLGIQSRYGEKPANKAELTRLHKILKTWVKNGGLAIEEREDKNRQKRKIYIVGSPSTQPEGHAEDVCTTLEN